MSMNFRLIVFSIFLLSQVILLSSCGFIEKPNPKDVTTKILNYGEGSAKVLEEHEDENVPSGKRFTTDYNLGISQTSDTINLYKGVQFGIEYIIESPRSSLIDIKTVWYFPSSIVNNERREFSASEYSIRKLTNKYTYSSYELNQDYEMKEGEWIIELFYEDKKILKKSFFLISNSD